MTAEFVPLAELLRGNVAASESTFRTDEPPESVTGPRTAASAATVSATIVPSAAPLPASAAAAAEVSLLAGPRRGDRPLHDECSERADATVDALRDARLFRARLADALDAAVARLARDIAADVLVRELRLAPCDVAALVQHALNHAPVVRVRVAPGDVLRVRDVPVIADPALSEGDAIVELANGALDARLGVRLAVVLEAFA